MGSDDQVRQFSQDALVALLRLDDELEYVSFIHSHPVNFSNDYLLHTEYLRLNLYLSFLDFYGEKVYTNNLHFHKLSCRQYIKFL